MLVTRGLGPSPELATAGMGPLALLEGGFASGVYGWVSTATGARMSQGSATADYGWTSTADGKFAALGSASGIYGWISTADGFAPVPAIPTGTAAAVYGWFSSAAGGRMSLGSANSDYGWASIAYARGEMAGIMVLTDIDTGRIIIVDRRG